MFTNLWVLKSQIKMATNQFGNLTSHFIILNKVEDIPHNILHNFLIKLCFVQSNVDPCIYVVINDIIKMSQYIYLKNILKKFDMKNCKSRTTPCESYYKDEANNDVISKKKYWKMVGILVHLMICTQPNLSYVLTKLLHHLSKPKSSDWVLLTHVFQYIKGIVNYCLTFQKMI